MPVRTKIQEVAAQAVPLLVLVVCCLSSLIIATNVRCHSSLTVYLYDQLPTYGQREEFHWLGTTHGMFVYLFVPLWTGVIDHFKISYRLSSLAAGMLILMASVMSTGLADPGYLIVTDTALCGTGASVLLSTIILVIDDYFPNSSSCRVLATTMVQGVALGTFFLVNAYSIVLTHYGWQAVFYTYGISCACLSLLGCILFRRGSRPYQPLPPPQKQRPQQQQQQPQPQPAPARLSASSEAVADVADDSRDLLGSASSMPAGESVGDSSVIDRIADEQQWRGRLLSLSQSELDSSRTILLWMLERLLAAVVSDGAFLFLLLHSGILRHPLTSKSSSLTRVDSITTAFLFSVGSTTSYMAGGIFGCLLRGKLLTIYIVGSLVNICALIGWAAVLGSNYSAELAFAWACGFGVGSINTVSFAASEEATGVQARSVFPFTKIANGMSIVVMEISYTALAGSERAPSETMLLVLLLLSIGEFAVLVLVRQINVRVEETRRRFTPRPSFRD